MGAQKKLMQLLRERKCISFEPYAAKRASKNRTSNIEELTNEEAETEYQKLLPCTADFLISYIYDLCSTMGIIYSKERCLVNDTLIFAYCKYHFPDSVEISSQGRLSELEYLTLATIAELISEAYAKKAVVFN